MDASTPLEDAHVYSVHGRKFNLDAFEQRHPGGPHAIGLGKGRE
jgi:hypothetical protein